MSIIASKMDQLMDKNRSINGSKQDQRNEQKWANNSNKRIKNVVKNDYKKGKKLCNKALKNSNKRVKNASKKDIKND